MYFLFFASIALTTYLLLSAYQWEKR